MDNNLVYLVQTDTTVGFLSNNNKKLSSIKQRDQNQKILQVVDRLSTLKLKVRVPNNRKNSLRRSNLATFIYPNGLSFRVVDKTTQHHKYINKFKCLYSTSANITKKEFNESFAVQNSDIILYNNQDFKEMKASSIYKINNFKIKKLR